MSVDAETEKEAQHQRLMDGLAASIREKGLAQTQVSDIVRHAHASRRTFYNHFEDKEACFVELMKGLADAFLEAVDRAIDRGQPISVADRSGGRHLPGPGHRRSRPDQHVRRPARR